jgi:4-nitrophenyl phosphatase
VHVPAEQAKALREIGFATPNQAVLTPASSAVDLFRRRRPARVMVLGAGLPERSSPPRTGALGTSRAISAMVTSVTGRRAELVSKPSRYALAATAR